MRWVPMLPFLPEWAFQFPNASVMVAIVYPAEKMMKALSPDAIAPPFARYSHGIEIPTDARIVRTSGQLGLDRGGSVPVGSEAQAQICFSNITAILDEAGMRAEHVFHLSAYVTEREHMAGYMTARDAFLSDVSVLPTSTLVIVSGFTRPEFVVEIEVWAARAP